MPGPCKTLRASVLTVLRVVQGLSRRVCSRQPETQRAGFLQPLTLSAWRIFCNYISRTPPMVIAPRKLHCSISPESTHHAIPAELNGSRQYCCGIWQCLKILSRTRLEMVSIITIIGFGKMHHLLRPRTTIKSSPTLMSLTQHFKKSSYPNRHLRLPDSAKIKYRFSIIPRFPPSPGF